MNSWTMHFIEWKTPSRYKHVHCTVKMFLKEQFTKRHSVWPNVSQNILAEKLLSEVLKFVENLGSHSNFPEMQWEFYVSSWLSDL